ncbi:hypothetical protein CsSME_00043710 [Camellia sinensis var. sinensis]
MPMMKPLTSLDFNSSVFNSSDTTRATWSRRYWRDSGIEEWQARTSVLQRRVEVDLFKWLLLKAEKMVKQIRENDK